MDGEHDALCADQSAGRTSANSPIESCRVSVSPLAWPRFGVGGLHATGSRLSIYPISGPCPHSRPCPCRAGRNATALKRHRGGDGDENVIAGIHLTINGLAAGLRNTG